MFCQRQSWRIGLSNFRSGSDRWSGGRPPSESKNVVTSGTKIIDDALMSIETFNVYSTFRTAKASTTLLSVSAVAISTTCLQNIFAVHFFFLLFAKKLSIDQTWNIFSKEKFVFIFQLINQRDKQRKPVDFNYHRIQCYLTISMGNHTHISASTYRHTFHLGPVGECVADVELVRSSSIPVTNQYRYSTFSCLVESISTRVNLKAIFVFAKNRKKNFSFCAFHQLNEQLANLQMR